MIELLRDWVVGIAAAAFLSAIARAVCPEGTVKNVVRMAGGLVLILAVIRPLLGVSPDTPSIDKTPYDVMVEEEMENLGRAGEVLCMEIIEDKTAAYILTEVQTRKLSLTVTARCKTPGDGGYPYPYSVSLRGRASPEEKESLSRWIAAELGIPPDRQEWMLDKEE